MDFLLQGMFTAGPKTALQESSQFYFNFSLSTFVVEWTKLHLRSHGELSTVVAMGFVA